MAVHCSGYQSAADFLISYVYATFTPTWSATFSILAANFRGNCTSLSRFSMHVVHEFGPDTGAILSFRSSILTQAPALGFDSPVILELGLRFSFGTPIRPPIPEWFTNSVIGFQF